MTRHRLDSLLAERGLAGSRTSAAASVRAGRVRIGRDGPLAVKPGQLVPAETELVVSEPPAYVSRGGVKLANALAALSVGTEGRDCLDVGHGQLDWGLRNDPRVEVMERTNAREMRPTELSFVPTLATIDVSFISLSLVLPAVAAGLAARADVLALVKPQFELGPDRVGKGGVVRSADDRRDALASAARAATAAGLVFKAFASSGLPGPKGNRESFMLCTTDGDAADAEAAAREVEPPAEVNLGEVGS